MGRRQALRRLRGTIATAADIRKLAQGARGEDEAGYRAEFMGMIDMAAVLRPNVVPATPTEEVEDSTPPQVPVPSVN